MDRNERRGTCSTLKLPFDRKIYYCKKRLINNVMPVHVRLESSVMLLSLYASFFLVLSPLLVVVNISYFI